LTHAEFWGHLNSVSDDWGTMGQGCRISSIILKQVKFTYHFPTPRPFFDSGEIVGLKRKG